MKPKTNEEIIEALKNNEAYKHIDIDRELKKADAWCLVNNRRCTPKFFVNWLNRIDPPLRPPGTAAAPAAPASEAVPVKCGECFDTGEISVEVPADRRQFTHQMEFIPCPSCREGGSR